MRLTPLTDQFSRTLGDATRKTKMLLLIANLAAAAHSCSHRGTAFPPHGQA